MRGGLLMRARSYMTLPSDEKLCGLVQMLFECGFTDLLLKSKITYNGEYAGFSTVGYWTPRNAHTEGTSRSNALPFVETDVRKIEDYIFASSGCVYYSQQRLLFIRDKIANMYMQLDPKIVEDTYPRLGAVVLAISSAATQLALVEHHDAPAPELRQRPALSCWGSSGTQQRRATGPHPPRSILLSISHHARHFLARVPGTPIYE